MNELGKYLKELRGEKSLREAAKQIGISHTYLDTIEKGFDKRSKKQSNQLQKHWGLLLTHTMLVLKNYNGKSSLYISARTMIKEGLNMVSEFPHMQYNSNGEKLYFDKQELKNYYDSVERDFDDGYNFKFLNKELEKLNRTLRSYEKSINKGIFEYKDIEKYIGKFINDLFLKDKIPVVETIKPGTSLLDEVNIVDYQLFPSPLKNEIIFLYKVSDDSFSNRRINKNDLLIVDGNIDEYFNGDMVLIIKNQSELMLKELLVKGNEEIFLTQPDAENIRLTDEHYIAGKIVKVIFEP